MGEYADLLKRREEDMANRRYPSLTLKDQDPIKWEVLHTKLVGVAHSSYENAKRISASPITRELGECLFALFTPEGDAVAFSPGILIHVGSMGTSVKWMLSNGYEEDPGIKEGDYFFNNDAYIGGAHCNDQLIVTPMFYGGKLVGWSGGLTHVPEIGAPEAGGNTPFISNSYEEGICWPCVKLAENEKIRRDFEIIVQRRTRMPEWWLLDNRAKVAGCRLIRDGAKALIDQYGIEYYLKAIYEYIEDTRQACQKRLASVLFPGRYRAATYLDVPNKGKRTRVPIDHEVRLAAETTFTPDGEMFVDFDGTSRAGWHCNNSTIIALQGHLLSMLCMHTYYDVKYNQGILQAYSLNVPPSTINPPEVAYSTAFFSVASQATSAVLETISRAYYPAGYREEVWAALPGVCRSTTGGTDQYGRRFAAHIFEHGCGGGGATGVSDGADVSGAPFNPEGDSGDAEVWEKIIPQMYMGRGILPDSGGFGKYRGGNALESLFLIENSDDVEQCSMGSITYIYASPGVMGAYPASANYRYLYKNTNFHEAVGNRLPLPHREGDDPAHPSWTQLLQGDSVLTDGQTFMTRMYRGEFWSQQNGGAGGFGDPIERNPEAVRQDVQNGVSTLRTAEKVYCVRLDPKTLNIDYEATALLRQRQRDERKARAIPVSELVQQTRDRVLRGEIPEMAKTSLNQCLEDSKKFLNEFRECWNLPDDFDRIP